MTHPALETNYIYWLPLNMAKPCPQTTHGSIVIDPPGSSVSFEIPKARMLWGGHPEGGVQGHGKCSPTVLGDARHATFLILFDEV
jgi:hypothetical protein